MKVFVTGGSGFVGRFTIPLLVSTGYEVAALARSNAAADLVSRLGAEPIHGNLDDASSLLSAFAQGQSDVLLNIASLGFGHAPTIVECAQVSSFRQAMFVSTTAVETKLNSTTKAVRLAAEDVISTSTLSWSIFRPTMIYGAPGDRNIERLLAALRRFPILPVPGNGKKLQQPVHVEDLAQGLVNAIGCSLTQGKIYNVAGPQPLSFNELIDVAREAVGSNTRTVRVPLTPSIGMVRTYERYSSKPKLRAEQLERLTEDKAYSVDAARIDLGFNPRTFEVGVANEVSLLWPT